MNLPEGIMRYLSSSLVLLLAASCGTMRSAVSVGAELAEATSGFLSSLDDKQRLLALRELNDKEAVNWHFVPGRYAGVEMGALTGKQKALAHQVLRTMLSATGFAKAMAIADLENVLHEMESKPNKPAAHRDPSRYALLVCGTPEPGGTFVVRYQGHHVSLRMAVVEGMLVGHTPTFLGTNPHVVPEQFARPVVLRNEEALGRELLAMFEGEQRAKVIIADTAPPDVLLGPGKAPAELGERRGLAWADMSKAQQDALWRLLQLHANVLRPDVAKQDLARIRNSGLAEMSFAWAGSTEMGKGHYYRIHGNHFAVEYDCTQNDANHVHVCWRDFENDFGGDALRRHREEQHGR
ncbi:MAG: hypothetical protein ACI89X_000745 [Planctomycetota bacterium]|jgi:hypothetical protein